MNVLRNIRQNIGFGTKIAVHLDNARFHHSKLVKEFAETEEIDIRLCFGLPYRPDLAPIESIYQHAKHIYRRKIDRLKALNKEWD